VKNTSKKIKHRLLIWKNPFVKILHSGNFFKNEFSISSYFHICGKTNYLYWRWIQITVDFLGQFLWGCAFLSMYIIPSTSSSSVLQILYRTVVKKKFLIFWICPKNSRREIKYINWLFSPVASILWGVFQLIKGENYFKFTYFC